MLKNLPLTRHSVCTILSAFASVSTTLPSNLPPDPFLGASESPTTLLEASAKVPRPTEKKEKNMFQKELIVNIIELLIVI